MNDQHEPDPPSDLTNEEEARVRRLLADARHTDPMPDDVVARLDRVLGGLAEEPNREAAVVRLADRRRRATRLLVAAAAVVVVGVGGSQVIGGLGAGESDNALSGAADQAEPESAEEPGMAGGDAETSGGEELGDQPNAEPGPTEDLQVAKVRPDHFAADAEALRDGRTHLLTAPQGARGNDSALDAVCTTGDWGVGRYVAVRYAGDPGWIVFRRPQGDTQVADLFLCGSEVAVRSLTLPYP